MRSVTRQRKIPEAIRSHSGMVSPDYVDLFSVTTDETTRASPERWSRTTIEDAAGTGGQFIWRGVLGLRLNSRPAGVGGWRIAGRGDDWIRLEASSWFLTAHLVIHLDGKHLSVGTFIRYDHPIATLVWTPASTVHRQLMPDLLRKTMRLQRRMDRDAAPSPQTGH